MDARLPPLSVTVEEIQLTIPFTQANGKEGKRKKRNLELNTQEKSSRLFSILMCVSGLPLINQAIDKWTTGYYYLEQLSLKAPGEDPIMTPQREVRPWDYWMNQFPLTDSQD